MNTSEDNTVQTIANILQILPLLISGVPPIVAIIFLNCFDFELSLFIEIPLAIFSFICGILILFYTLENQKIISNKIINLYQNGNKIIKLFIKFLIFIFSILFFVFLLFFYVPRI